MLWLVGPANLKGRRSIVERVYETYCRACIWNLFGYVNLISAMGELCSAVPKYVNRLYIRLTNIELLSIR